MVYSKSESHGCNWLCKFMAFSHMSRSVFKHIAVWVWIVHLSVESLILKLTWKLIGTLIIAYLIFDFLVYKWCCTSARVSVFSARTLLITMTTKCSMLLRMAVFFKAYCKISRLFFNFRIEIKQLGLETVFLYKYFIEMFLLVFQEQIAFLVIYLIFHSGLLTTSKRNI